MTKGGEGGSRRDARADGDGLRPRPGNDENHAAAVRRARRGRHAANALPIPELLSPAQAAQVLGVTEADVIASLDAGDLKGKKIGSTWRITRDRHRRLPRRIRPPAMAEVSALRKHPCPECGGDAEWNASKKALACPYCGTILPWSDGENPLGAPSSSTIWKKPWPRFPTRPAACATRKNPSNARAARPSACSMPGPRRAALRFLRLARHRAGRRPAGPHHAGEPAARRDPEHPRPRPTPQVVSQPLVGAPTNSSVPRSPTPSTASISPTGPSTPTSMPLDRGVRILLLCHRASYRGSRRPERRPARCARPAGNPAPAASRISSMTMPCPAPSACTPRCCARWSPSPPSPTSSPTIPPMSAAGRSSAIRSICARPRRPAGSRWTRHPPALRARCSRRHPSQSPGPSHYQGRTFKHILVPVWLVTYDYGANPIRSWSTATPGKWPASIRRAGSRSRSPCSRCSSSC
jgi:hypothetical protein